MGRVAANVRGATLAAIIVMVFAAVIAVGESAHAQQALSNAAQPSAPPPDLEAALSGGFPESAPPEARINRAAAVWPGYAVMFVLAVVVIGISMMPSKRAHTD